ncbi:hypothetical protein BpHYR1_022096 [Brachionus plicatilis]|uniref:Uncharacterized protein n=1 Tax=Brachionus plicatilis TaxID=10195 RepID=A0A3M7SVR7_BRAPC|nr:hypothetical protein BpHYR1_022096 [Brachionus plicatilis]
MLFNIEPVSNSSRLSAPVLELISVKHYFIKELKHYEDLNLIKKISSIGTEVSIGIENLEFG